MENLKSSDQQPPENPLSDMEILELCAAKWSTRGKTSTDKCRQYVRGDYNWLERLQKQPELMAKIDKNAWAYLLAFQPAVAEIFDRWDEFNGYDWSWILQTQPQFADKCDKWDSFSGDDWRWLLDKQPQFADKCDKWDEFDTSFWVSLLCEQPQFAERCDIWGDFTDDEWNEMLYCHPQLVKYKVQ